MYQLAIFDLDGTLLDTLADLRQGLNYALSTQGFAPRTLPEVRAFVGNGIRKLVERAVPAGTSRRSKRSSRRSIPITPSTARILQRPIPAFRSCCGSCRRTASCPPSCPTSRIMP